MPRLFVAVNLPDAIKDRIAAISETLRKNAGPSTFRWSERDQYHVTLKFLGETGDEKVSSVIECVREVSAKHRAFDLSLGSIGTFGEGARLKNVWVGLTGDVVSLRNLAEELERELEPLGFPPEGRGYSPHITIVRAGRETTLDERIRLEAALRELDPLEEPFHVGTMELMKSRTLPEGAVYEALRRFALRESS